ncbi:MAG: UbiA-like protein EboC [Chitinophagaceae bacterium]|nr:UbiA-like protein EboC [Chitinophagaceae bacterium]
MRLANIITAVSDILAGIAISGYFLSVDQPSFSWAPVILLILSTVGLYGGGVVWNDVFDAELDAKERPERPIPGGLITKTRAALFGAVLLAVGIVSAAFVHDYILSGSFLIATGIAAGALLYDKWGKHHAWLGPLNMGICRGLNLLLGISIIPAAIQRYWYICIVPIVYIAAITMISRGEVHGGKKNTLYAAGFLYGLVLTGILIVSFVNQSPGLYVLVFAGLLAALIFPPLRKAIREPEAAHIGKAVKSGVIALIVMNAAWAAAFGMPYTAIVILLLLPLSLFLANLFAVT